MKPAEKMLAPEEPAEAFGEARKRKRANLEVVSSARQDGLSWEEMARRAKSLMEKTLKRLHVDEVEIAKLRGEIADKYDEHFASARKHLDKVQEILDRGKKRDKR